MEYCNICNNILIRNSLGVLTCRNGHIKTDIISKQISEIALQKKKELRKRMTTFPDPDKNNIVVLRLKNPLKNLQRKTLMGWTGNGLPTFEVYEELHKLESEYDPSEFRYLRGNIFASGGREAKFGWVLCNTDILPEILKRIEKVMLKDGSHYTLEEISITKAEVKERIRIEKENIEGRIK